MMLRLVALVCTLAVLPSLASADVVERVVGTVNNDAIFLSDLRARAAPFLPQVAEARTETERKSRLKELYEELLTLLIDEKLIRQIASQSGIRVTDADVDLAVENLRVQNNLTEEQFKEALEAQGFSEEQYRRDLKKQLVRLKVMNERVRARVNITEEEVHARYEERARESGSELRYRVSHVLIPVEDTASATDVAAVRQKAEELRAKLTPENFAAETEELGGGDLGWISPGDLPKELEQSLGSLRIGEISQPIRGNTGFHIFFVQDRQVGSDFPTYDEMKQELYREMLDVAMTRQEKIFLEEIRRKAVINRML
ncbi:MAG: peptidyl-prolyl cis-trans isomerase [Polyangiales bacterium]|jgi:peptidyl-prolyl cis-trans isomerase SurA